MNKRLLMRGTRKEVNEGALKREKAIIGRSGDKKDWEDGAKKSWEGRNSRRLIKKNWNRDGRKGRGYIRKETRKDEREESKEGKRKGRRFGERKGLRERAREEIYLGEER